MPRVVGGFAVGQFTPENVLRANGLDTRATVDQLVAAAAPHDATNPGYLSQAELQKGADDLLVSLANAPTTTNTTTSAGAFDYSRKVLSDIKDQYLRGVPGRTFTDDELVNVAAQWDDGNGYLKKKELEAGAMELQITSTGAPLRASDLAAIRTWTGCERKSTPPLANVMEIGVISDIDKTLMPPTSAGNPEPAAYPGVAALLTLLEQGPQGNGALGDVTYVTARNTGRVTNIPTWLANNGLPAGGIETGTSSVPWIAEDEKVRDIERVFTAHPTQKFVLFGDTNHRDPDVYKRIRDRFPTQVSAVIMHDVKTVDPARLDGHLVVKNYAEAAAKLLSLQLIDEAGARGVMVNAKAGGLAITDAEIDALVASHRP
jgi:phosphatidate phosphatase APP1